MVVVVEQQLELAMSMAERKLIWAREATSRVLDYPLASSPLVGVDSP